MNGLRIAAVLVASLLASGAWADDAKKKDPNVGPGACARMRCAAGTICKNKSDGTGECVSVCEDKKCGPRQECVVNGSHAKCVMKKRHANCNPKCTDGKVCAWKQVTCIKAPCPPVAECVDKSAGSVCDKTKCKEGQTCVVLAMIPPKASCIDSSSLPGTESK